MSNQVTNHTFSTKVNKDAAEGVKTIATLEWDIDLEKIIELASRAVIIDQQAIYRISGKIPTAATLKVSEVLAEKKALRGGSKPMSKDELVNKVKSDPEMFRAMLEQMGFSAQQVAKTMKEKFPEVK